MVLKFIYAVAVAIIVGLLIFIIGAGLVQAGVLLSLGEFLKNYAAFIGVLAGISYFFFGGTPTRPSVV